MMNALNGYNYDCAPQEFEEIFEQSISHLKGLLLITS